VATEAFPRKTQANASLRWQGVRVVIDPSKPRMLDFIRKVQAILVT